MEIETSPPLGVDGGSPELMCWSGWIGGREKGRQGGDGGGRRGGTCGTARHAQHGDPASKGNPNFTDAEKGLKSLDQLLGKYSLFTSGHRAL